MRRIKLMIMALMVMMLLAPTVSASTYDKKEVKFSRIQNARDFGGYRTSNGKTVKKNVFIRSAELSYATKGDMAKLKKQYRLKRVYDFRHPNDFKYCPDKRISGVSYIRLPIEKRGSRSVKSAKERYRTKNRMSNSTLRYNAIKVLKPGGKKYTYQIVMSSYSQRQYKKYFNYLLSNRNADGVLIHCVHGKDRTGVAAFMTLIALGVPENVAYREFSMTNDWVKKYSPKLYKKGVRGVRTSDLQYAVKKAKKKYGSMGRFLNKAYGLDSNDLKKLRQIYTQ